MSKLKKLKIAFVIDYFYGVSGGTERQLYVLIKGLISKGYEVSLFVLRHTDFTLNHHDSFPCVIFCLNSISIASLKTLINMYRFRKLIKVKKITTVHVYFDDAAILIPLSLAFLRVPVFTSRRDMGIGYNFFRIMALRMANLFVKKVICNSNAVAQLVKNKENLSLSKVSVIYNGIAHDYVPIQELPDVFEIYSNEFFNVVMVANVRFIKGMLDLIFAAYELKKINIHYKFNVWIVGGVNEPEYFSILKRKVKELDLSDIVIFTGKISEPRSILRFMDIGVLTSQSEGFSNTLLEYLDAKLPVVCTNVGGNPELVKHGINGFLYESGRWEDLARHLDNIMNNYDNMKGIREAAGKTVEKYTYNEMIDNQESMYLTF